MALPLLVSTRPSSNIGLGAIPVIWQLHPIVYGVSLSNRPRRLRQGVVGEVTAGNTGEPYPSAQRLVQRRSASSTEMPLLVTKPTALLVYPCFTDIAYDLIILEICRNAKSTSRTPLAVVAMADTMACG